MTIAVTLEKEKDCKHSVRYSELSAVEGDNVLEHDVLGTIYLKRKAMREGVPQSITITLEQHQ